MTYNFFADEEDKIAILEYILSQTDLRIYDLYSAYGEELRSYPDLESLVSTTDLKEGGQFSSCFHLWDPAFEGKVRIERITLNPRYCEGHSFRFASMGWGLIKLYFGGIENGQLNYSHIGHFNEKGALRREAEGPKMAHQKVRDWNWAAIRKCSRNLKYYIHEKLAVRKMGSKGLLPAAANLLDAGAISLGS